MQGIIQLSSVAQLCLTLCNPMYCSMTALPVHHQLLEFTQTHNHGVRDAIQPSHPVSSPSPPPSILPSIRVFFNELAPCIRCSGGISQPRNVFIEILPVKPTSFQGNRQDLTFSFYLSTLVSVAKASGRQVTSHKFKPEQRKAYSTCSFKENIHSILS